VSCGHLDERLPSVSQLRVPNVTTTSACSNMTRSAILSTALLLGTRAFAAYDKFHYTTEASNWLCPGMAWQCIAPSICAHDGLTDLYNCCDSDADDAVCWNNSTPCEGEEDNTPASNQIGCSSGANAFCCLKGRWVHMGIRT
jgi:hypothetical protein